MNNIPWKTFSTEKDGVKLEVTWWMHDFTAEYKVGDIVLKYGRHIMAMCPMKYSEEWLKNDFEKNGLYVSFKEAGEIITSQQVFFEATKAQFAITKKNNEKQIEELNSKLRELKQKYKAGELIQNEYKIQKEALEHQKNYIRLDYYDICSDIAKDIAVINQEARSLITGYLHDLWRNCYTPTLYAWKIYVPDSDDFYTKEQEKFEEELRRGHYDFEKISGKTDQSKCIYFLPNITKEDSEEMSGHFQNVYSYRAYQRNLSDEDRQKELDDFLTSKKLKEEFPLSLTKLSENFFKRYPYKHPDIKMSEIKVYIRNGAKHTGRERWLYRARMYHHPESWELEEGFRNKYYEMWKKE